MTIYYNNIQLYIFIAVAALIFIISVVLLMRWLKNRNLLPRSLNMIALLITVPKEVKPITEEAKKEEKEIISIAEQVYANMHAIKKKGLFSSITGSDYLGMEIVAVDGEIRFYVVVPRKYREYIEKTIQSQYPKALIEESGDYNIFKPGYKVKGGYLILGKSYYLPIKTYQKLEADPINALTNSLSKLQEDEGAVIQVLFRPASKKWISKGRDIAKKMRSGKSLKSAKSVVASQPAKIIGQIGVSKDVKGQAEQKQDMLTPVEEETMKSIEEKAAKLGFEVNIRIIASSKTEEQALSHYNNLKDTFTQYTDPNLNKIIAQTPRRKRKFINDFIYRNFKASNKTILNTEELASISHLPTKFTETPNIKWLLSKDAPPPPNMPKEGLLLGKNNYRGVETKINFQDSDRRRHMYIIGQTGTGKSVFLQNMIIQDIKAGKGVCVIDPHGDLIDGVIPHVPKERAEEVVLFEPFNMDRPMGLNMLEYGSEDQKDFTVQEMINIFYKLFPPEMIGPMFEHNMRNVMLTLMSDKDNPGTIIEIPRMFTDEDYQKEWVNKVKDPVVKSFWENEMAKTSDFHKSEMLGYLISKVGRFVENEMMRNIMGQSHSAFDLRDIMDNEKILLVNLSKGKVGEVNSSLLGLIIVSKIQMAAMARADMPEEQRKDFYLYVDEFQNFATDSFASILAEARKYRLNLIVAHQYVSQLEEDIRDAVFGNVGSFVTFRIGVEDAEIIAKEFDPVFSETDVINIERFHAYLRLMVNSQKSTPFTMGTYPPIEGESQEIANAVRQLSRLKFGKDRKMVEADIMERSQLGANKASLNPVGESQK